MFVVPTMQKIAEAAGVSRMTVSLAMRNSPRISAQTRERIQQLAAEMGYRPNPLVSTLMAQRSGKKRINAVYPLALINSGLTSTHFGHPFYRLMIAGIKERAEELGFDAQIFHVNLPGAPDSRRLDKILRNRGIRGVIVLPLPEGTTELDFPWEFYSAATLGHSLLKPELHRSASDQFRNGWLAMENIYRLGYRRPGLVISPEIDRRTHFHFPAAYFSFPRDHPDVVVAPTFSGRLETQVPAFRKWLRAHKPDVILRHDDSVSQLRDLGLRIPEEMGFVGINLLESESGTSGVNPLVELVGAGAVDVVVARLHRSEFGLPPHSQTVLTTGEWVEGTTTLPRPAI